MARKPKQLAEPAPDEVTVESPPLAAPEPLKSKSVTVYSRTGGRVRTYSADEHGPDFKKLAEGYASKIAGTVR